jgi:hypothetical protein
MAELALSGMPEDAQCEWIVEDERGVYELVSSAPHGDAARCPAWDGVLQSGAA